MPRATRRWTARLATLVSVLAVGGLSLVAAPAGLLPAAGAATCTSAGGVSVVVDHRELGGAVFTACAADGGGRSATAIFASVGVQLTYAQRSPGFVCRVNGQPAADPCVNTSPADAYWGLWWADGTRASWTYSSYSAGSLTVPAGGSVGWSWQQDRGATGAVSPSVSPPVHQATPTATPTPSEPASSAPGSSPSPSPTSSPSGGSGGSGGGGSGGSGGSGSGGSGSSSSPSPTPTGSGGGAPGGSGAGSSGGSDSSPQASPSSSPASPSGSPSASESPGDSQAKRGSKKGSDDDTSDDESPGDSEASEGAGGPGSEVESPSDSSASAAPEAGEPSADEPARIPAAVSWSIVGLLAIAIAGSAVVARRRRGV